MIDRIETFLVPPRWIFVRVSTDDDLVGWGEAIVPKRSRAVVGAVQDLADNIRGTDPSRIEELWQRMRTGGFFRDGPILCTAAAAIEHALWDIKGRRHGLAVHDFLGGRVRDHVRLYAWVAGDRPDDVVTEVRTRIGQGFSAVKMNATAELDWLDSPAKIDAAVARVGAIRDAFGYDVDVAVDCHGRVHRAMAKSLLRELAPLRPMWVEEPLAPGDLETLREISRHASGVPIATGERILSRWHFAQLLETRAVDVIQPDVSLTGLFELEKLTRMAEAYDVVVAPHCPNGPISLAASLQVDACASNVVIQEQSIGLHYNRGYAGLTPGDMADYLLDPTPLTPVDGRLAVPTGPGLGIDIDAAVVRERDGAWRLPDQVWRYEDGRLAEW